MATMLTNVNLSACRRPVYTTYELSEPGKNDCNMRFSSGLADDPHKKNKGEIVSVIYAEYYHHTFLKSNDTIFNSGREGRNGKFNS